MANQLFYGDNLEVLRDSIKDESIDLIYLDPPFNSAATYNVLFRAPSGENSQAQIEAFEDTWHWNDTAADAFDQVMKGGASAAAEMLQAMKSFLKENDMMAYLAMMAVRLLELQRVLKPTGSLYLHCDPTASHYLKLLLDAIFGPRLFASEIIWKRTTAHSSAKRYAPIHDTIFFYRPDKKFTWNEPRIGYEDEYLDRYYKYDDGDGQLYWRADITGAGVRSGDSGLPWKGRDPTRIRRHWSLPEKVLAELAGEEAAKAMTTQQKLELLDDNGLIYWPKGDGMPMYKRYRHQLKGRAVGDIWDDLSRINPVGGERLGYPTQKPVALLERVVSASSNEGDVVLDPFCGCGTTIHAAEKLKRRWVGIDVTHLAIALVERRLREAFPSTKFETHGVPKDLSGAEDLAAKRPFEFERWAVSLIPDAQPYKSKGGADSGIDGILFLRTGRNQTDKALISVKGGKNIGPSMVRDLKGTVEREKAIQGIFVTLVTPSKAMAAEAAAGFVEHEGRRYPKMQIVTIKDLLDGKRPQVPLIDSSVFKKAATEIDEHQAMLDFTAPSRKNRAVPHRAQAHSKKRAPARKATKTKTKTKKAKRRR